MQATETSPPPVAHWTEGLAGGPGLALASPPRWHLALALAVIALLAVAIGVQTWAWQVDDERQTLASRLEVHAAALDTELTRHEALPMVLALDPRLGAALAAPQDAAVIAAGNVYLQQTQLRTGAEAVFLIDSTGKTVAASNHDQPDSFIGQNYAFRPYVQEALAGRLGRFYAVGTTTGRPGYFLAAPVQRNPRGDAAGDGVVAVKVSLAAFEASLKPGGGVTVLADGAGVLMLSSEPGLRYRTLAPLSEQTRQGLDATRQYTGQSLQAVLPGTDLLAADKLPRLPTLLGVSAEPALAGLSEVVRRPAGGLGWQLVAFVDTPNARRTGLLAGTACGLAGMGTVMLWQMRALRRRRRAELLQVEDEIRRRIALGTEHLHAQLAEQARTENLLRRTTDSAVQAGKLAVLGQLAAGISHELNQPLTAMRNYADNALLMMDTGRAEGVRGNLQQIGALTDRMGQITSHLRAHARMQPEPVGPVSVRGAVDNALVLLRATAAQGAAPTVDIQPPGLQVLAEPVRLEQALVNLLRNAMDAGQGRAASQISATVEGTQVCIRVRDHGPGMAPDVLARLFEPFFTTKPAGSGLGLGLAVSRMIVRGLGGELQAGNAAGGGAEFSVFLPRAMPLPPSAD